MLSCGPWCQGPVLLQMLSLLDEVDLEALGHNSKDYVHLLAEVMNLCFADRERYYGDLLRRRAHGDVAVARLCPGGAAEDDPPRSRLWRDAAGRFRRRPCRGPHQEAVGGRRRAGTAGRHFLCLRRRSAGQRLFGDAERRVVGKPGHLGLGPARRRAARSRGPIPTTPPSQHQASGPGSRPIRRWPCARASS